LISSKKKTIDAVHECYVIIMWA